MDKNTYTESTYLHLNSLNTELAALDNLRTSVRNLYYNKVHERENFIILHHLYTVDLMEYKGKKIQSISAALREPNGMISIHQYNFYGFVNDDGRLIYNDGHTIIKWFDKEQTYGYCDANDNISKTIEILGFFDIKAE